MAFIGRAVAPAPISTNDVPDLPASKITSGTFATGRISEASVTQHASDFDDNKIVNDISTLALRQATNENAIAYNTNSQFIDVFQDGSGIASHTTSGRNDSEYVSSVVTSASSLIDFDDIDGSGTDVEFKTFGTPSGNSNLDHTSFHSINAEVSYHEAVDAKYWLDNWSGVGGNLGSFDNVPRDTTDRTNYGVIFDFKSSLIWGGTWYIGKQNGYGDMRKFQLQGSNDDSSYTNIDLSGVSRTATIRSNGSPSGSEGQFTSGSSDGSFILNQHAGQYWSTLNTLASFPTVSYRYLKFILMNQWTGSSNTNAGFMFNISKQSQTSNATGNFISNTITAPSSVNKIGAIITYQDALGTNSLNTDIVLQLSADGGSNFTTATMTALPDFSTGIKMAKVNDLTIGTAGTSLKYKISFANQSASKEARIRGVSLQY